MAHRRAIREVAKRMRLFSSSQVPLEEAFPAGEKGASWAGRRPRSTPGNNSLIPQWDAQYSHKAGSNAAWLLAAGGMTAMSTYIVSAGSTLSVEAPPTAVNDGRILKHAKRNRVVFVLGGPGSGKGTQCAKIVDEFGFTHLSAGDLLRAEIKSGSEYGNMIQSMIKEGKIVPAEVTVGLLQKAMTESTNNKFLIDGFPRNKENRQVFERDTGISPELILFFDCPQEVMEKRLLGRNQGRIDDNIETIRKRFKVFVDQSMPVVEYYEKFGKVRKVDATKSPDDVFKSYSTSFIRFIQDDLLEKSVELLHAIDTWDYATYARLCDPGLTSFEPEAQGHLIEGLPFHEYYFKLHGKGPSPPDQAALVQSIVASPTVTVIGDVGIVTYTRLLQATGSPKAGHTLAMNETRIWQRKEEDGKYIWKHIHFHRSLAPST